VVDPATGRRASVQAAYDDAAKDFQQMVEYGKSALDFGSTQWPGVPYPYSKTTIFRGMADEEYPMFANDDTNDDPDTTRFIAAHELLHSWFPFYMGINEQRYGFMDEGWTTAFEYLINQRDMGPEKAAEFFKHFRTKNLVTPFNGLDIPIITPSDALSGNVIGRNNYEKAALGFLALKELIGDAPFKAALDEFMARWATCRRRRGATSCRWPTPAACPFRSTSRSPMPTARRVRSAKTQHCGRIPRMRPPSPLPPTRTSPNSCWTAASLWTRPRPTTRGRRRNPDLARP
jgi:hypothetical protein